MSVLASKTKRNDLRNGSDMAALTAAVKRTLVRQILLTAAIWGKLGTAIDTVTHGSDGANLRLPKVKRVIRNNE